MKGWLRLDGVLNKIDKLEKKVGNYLSSVRNRDFFIVLVSRESVRSGYLYPIVFISKFLYFAENNHFYL